MGNDAFRVMVVDDDPDIAHYTTTIIQRRAGCEVLAVTDPLQARRAAARFSPDVVVTDIEMPGITGLELLTELRTDHPGLPIIVMTGHATTEYALRALRSQADEFLIKPASSSQLVDTVTMLAERWRRSKEADDYSDRATEVQRSLLPKENLRLVGYELAGGCKPAGLVGGDFFDWYPMESGAAFTLADVMGKGVGAAIIAATVRAVLRSTARDTSIARAITAAAEELAPDLERAGAFVTLFHGRVDVLSGEVSYLDAGHGLSLVVHAAGEVQRLSTFSFPLGTGIDDQWLEHTVSLSPGDTLISVSDGVLDLWDGTLASLDNVEDIVRAATSAQDIVDALLAKAGRDASDDVTVVVLRRLVG